jgi:hypothetical protein
MTVQMITNPQSKLKAVTDYRDGKTSSGELLSYGGSYEPFRANATITKGQALIFVVPTATVPLSVTPEATASELWYFAGYAMHGASAGQTVMVCQHGHCEVLVYDTTVVTIGDRLIKDGTNAAYGAQSASAIGTSDLPGNSRGQYLKAKASGADALVPAFVWVR